MALLGRSFEEMEIEPPTPPQDLDQNVNDALEFLKGSFEVEKTLDRPVFPKPPADTPEQSPSSSAIASNSSSRLHKKVGWSPFPQIHPPQDFRLRSPDHRSPLRPLPTARTSKPRKSILKPFEPPSHLNAAVKDRSPGGTPSPKKDTLGNMIQFIMRQLASKSREIRLDGYIALHSTLKAYDGVPDSDVMLRSLGLLTQFIERDLSVSGDESNAVDGNLATQATNLLIFLMRNPSLADKLDSKFCITMTERITTALEAQDTTKKTALLCVQILANQKFGPKILTADRVRKILLALQGLENRHTGNGVIGGRLAIYARLLELSPTFMLWSMPLWLEHVFGGMLSTNTDIRTRAIETGTSAAGRLGNDTQAYKAVNGYLGADQGSNFQQLKSRLEEMIASKEEGQLVPQIWAAVILLVRSKGPKLEKEWAYLDSWLSIIQKCMNSAEIRTKFHATLAWNIFVAVVKPGKDTSDVMCKRLRLPVTVGLEKKGHDKFAEQIRTFAISSYYNLLYYSFCPSAPAEQLGRYLEEYVVRVLSRRPFTSQDGAESACGILTALFGGYQASPWYAERAFQVQGVFKPKGIKQKELPRLDPKWIRRNLGKLLPVVDSCLRKASWSSNPEVVCPARRMWECLLVALSEAGFQEVTASMDLKSAMASLLNFLYTLWPYRTIASKDQQPIEVSEARFDFMVFTAVEKLGARTFTENFLTRKEGSDFEAAPTPSHRSRSHGPTQSALLHLLRLCGRDQSATATYPAAFAKKLLGLCCSSQNTRSTKLALLADSAEVAASCVAEHGVSVALSEIWQSTAKLASKALKTSPSLSSGRNVQKGLEFRHAVRVLRSGLQHASSASLEGATRLHGSLVEVVRREAGDGSLALAVTEPLSEACASWRDVPGADHGTVLHFASLILDQGHHPTSSASMQRARQTLWNDESAAASRKINFEPYSHLYNMVVKLSLSAYDSMGIVDHAKVRQFLISLSHFLASCPSPLLELSLRNIQKGISVWILDEHRKLEIPGSAQDIYQAVSFKHTE